MGSGLNNPGSHSIWKTSGGSRIEWIPMRDTARQEVNSVVTDAFFALNNAVKCICTLFI